MKFMGYKSADGSLTFIPEDNIESLELEIAPQLIFECDADTWEEACQQWHDFNGWEPYKPMDIEE